MHQKYLEKNGSIKFWITKKRRRKEKEKKENKEDERKENKEDEGKEKKIIKNEREWEV